MRKKILLLFLFCITFSSLFSQEITFNIKSGSYTVNNDFDIIFSMDDPYRMIFFQELPSENQKKELENLGINFLYYLSKNVYIISLSKIIDIKALENYQILSINKFLPDYKIDIKLQDDVFPEWCFLDDILYIKILLHKDVKLFNVIDKIKDLSELMQETNEMSNYVIAGIKVENLNLITRFSFVSYIEPIDPPPLMENMTGRTLHRTNIISSEYSNGRQYNGIRNQ